MHGHAVPVLLVVAVDQVVRLEQTFLARAAALRERRGLGHVLQHDPARAPVLGHARFDRAAVGQREDRRQLLGLGEVAGGAVRQRGAGDRRDALVGRHALPLVDEDRKIALAQLVEAACVGHPVAVEAGIGADARGLALFGWAVVIGRDHAHRAVGLHLQRQLPAQLDRLADQRGQQGHLGHQRLDRRGIVVLPQHAGQHAVEPRDAAPHVGPVKLKGQDGVVPGDFGADAHGVSLWAGRWHRCAI